MRKLLMTTLCVLFAGGVALGDWDEGDPFKMHHPQLPDPNGWDVQFVFPQTLADDWGCTQTGPVSDVHFWMSSLDDLEPDLHSIHVGIHKNIPAGASPYSLPGELLWERDFAKPEFTVRLWHEQGQQGWYDPYSEQGYPQGHHYLIWQANIENIQDPFTQDEGTIYWLHLTVEMLQPGTVPWYGWRTTSQDLAFEDIAVWGDIAGPWEPFFIEGMPVDLAFVITPEPATMSLLAVGGLVALRRRRRK